MIHLPFYVAIAVGKVLVLAGHAVAGHAVAGHAAAAAHGAATQALASHAAGIAAGHIVTAAGSNASATGVAGFVPVGAPHATSALSGVASSPVNEAIGEAIAETALGAPFVIAGTEIMRAARAQHTRHASS